MGADSSKELSHGDIENLKNCTRFSAKEIQEWHEKFHQDFPEGVIHKDQFVEMYSRIFTKGDASTFAKHVFNAYDTDGNGEIDFNEFMVTLSVSSRGTVDEKLHWAFKMYDLDNNGTVDRDETVEIMKAIFQMRGEYDSRKVDDSVDKIFLHLDKDKNGVLSEEEFINGAKHSRTIMEVLQGQ